MNNVTYLVDEKLTLEAELELIQGYEKFKGIADYDDESGRLGMKDLNNFEIKFGKSFLEKRIAWYEAEIKKAEQEAA